jgi:hypothetical protein
MWATLGAFCGDCGAGFVSISRTAWCREMRHGPTGFVDWSAGERVWGCLSSCSLGWFVLARSRRPAWHHKVDRRLTLTRRLAESFRMGQFTERVQSGAIPGPLRRSFTPDRWSREFASTSEPDERDRYVHEAALVIHNKLETIRSRLRLSSSPSLSATTKLRAFIAGANHNFVVARTKSRDAFEKAGAERAKKGLEGFWPGQLAAEIKLELRGGFEWSPDEIVESLVDGIEVPVRFALQGNPSLAGNPRMNQVQWSDIVLELNLGIMFRHAEDLWDDCLWNGYRVIDKGRMKAFIPQDLDVVRGYVIGHARRIALAMGYQVMATKYHRGLVERGLLPRLREVRAIEQHGKQQVLKLSKTSEHTETQEELFVMRGYANEPYYSELLEEPLALLDGLTLSSVLDAWMVISRAALVLVERVAKDDAQIAPDSPARSWLPEYAPVLQIDALVQALFAAAAIRPADGKRLVEFFTFRGAPGQEIWASPLVPVGSTTVAPVFAAVVSPNLRRLVDIWMRQVGLDLGKRGPAFEAHVRANAVDSIASSNVLAGHAVCIKDSYTFRPPADREEEIDLLFVIGSTVFVGEAKCVLEPTEAKGVAMHRKTVLGAANQIERKAQALLDNREAFVADVRRFGITLPTDFAIVRLIIVSTAAHVGTPANGVPVVDEYILEKFLVGELEDVAVKGGDLEIQQRVKTIFYTDLAEAQAKASQYFAQPPQLQPLLEGVVGRVVPIYAIDAQDWQGVVMTLACVPTRGGLAT